MDYKTFHDVQYRQFLNTCVLASYATACFPFTRTPVLNYFAAYCRHFKLDETHPEWSYENDFHERASKPGNSGYKIINCLHNNSNESSFKKANELVALEPVEFPKDIEKAEKAIRQPDCLLLQFINASPYPGLSMHSIVIGHDGNDLYYFDTSPGAVLLYRHRFRTINDFGKLGEAFLVSKK